MVLEKIIPCDISESASSLRPKRLTISLCWGLLRPSWRQRDSPSRNFSFFRLEACFLIFLNIILLYIVRLATAPRCIARDCLSRRRSWWSPLTHLSTAVSKCTQLYLLKKVWGFFQFWYLYSAELASMDKDPSNCMRNLSFFL